MRELGDRKVKYEAELDHDFHQQITDRMGDSSLMHCIQCGTCSATCPVSVYMDHTPRQIVSMIREGFKQEVLSSVTPWICSSCYSCTVECPKEVKITELMYTLKRKSIEEGTHEKGFKVPVLAEEFSKQVLRNGRTHEGHLMTRFLLKTNPLKLFKNGFLGLRLFKLGRMSLLPETIQNRDQLRALLHSVHDNNGSPTETN